MTGAKEGLYQEESVMSDQKRWECDTRAVDIFYSILPRLGYEPCDDGGGRRWVRTQDIKTTTELTLRYLEALKNAKSRS